MASEVVAFGTEMIQTSLTDFFDLEFLQESALKKKWITYDHMDRLSSGSEIPPVLLFFHPFQAQQVRPRIHEISSRN